MELLKKLKTAQIPKDDTPEEEIKFLDDSNLTNIVNKGLAELYRIQPENPITFLANFLLNENHAKVLQSRINDSRELKKKTEEKVQKEEEYLQQLQEENNKKEEERNEIKQKLRDSIINCEDYEDGLNDICEQLKNIIGATGVYISIYDLKRKEVTSLDEDENAHIDPENINVLRYIHWNNDHDFLHGKILEPKKGVTYQLFMDVSGDEDGEEGEEAPPEKNEGDGEEGEEGEVDDKKEEVLKSVEIQDVLMDNKIKFFREPRLGSYLAYNISYQSSLSYKSLLSAIANLNTYNEKNEEYEKLKAEKEEQDKLNQENKENEEEEEEDGEKKENENEGEEGEEEEGEKLVKPELEDFEKESKTLIISMDTLGQDRTFSDSQKEFAYEIAKLIKDSIQAHEKKLLEKDRDLRIDYMKIEKPLVEDWTPEKIEAEADNGMKDYLNSEEFLNKNITEDGPRKVEEDYGRANWNIQTLVTTDFLQCLEMFAQYEFVEYEKVFQNILYFAHIEPKEINEPETNKLSWKLARKHWVSIFDIFKEYTPLGAKPDQVLSIFKGNVILANLEPFTTEEKIEEIKEYSFALTRLIQYVVDILKVRKEDILQRHADQRAAIKNRNQIIKDNKQIMKDRKKALKRAKRNFGKKEGEELEEEKEEEEKEEEEEEEEEEKEKEKGEENEEEEKKEGEEGEEAEGEEKEKEEVDKKEGGEEGEVAANPLEGFNEEEWLAQYDQEHPLTPVPDEVVVDEDNDFDVEENLEGEENEKKDDGDD